jgi:hypothetical protein
MTNQEYFDIAYPHLTRPGFTRSAEEVAHGRMTCLYAGPDGNSCGIGCALPRGLGEQLDKLNDTDWDGVRDAAVQGNAAAAEAVALLHGVDRFLLSDVQGCHDVSWHTDSDRRTEMHRIAAEFSLAIPGEP